MTKKAEQAVLALIAAIALLVTSSANAEMFVRISTVLGDIDLELFEKDAPKTVANFMNYVNDGDYANSLVHRLARGFVIQGGGFTPGASGIERIPTDAPVENEFKRSNTRGTIAMAKIGGDPDSATNQWFINLTDNDGSGATNLDTSNGGFTVFGQVIRGLEEVVDAIASLPRADLTSLPSALVDVTFNPTDIGGAFSETPLVNYTQQNLDNGEPIEPEHLVMVNDITVIPEPASITILLAICGLTATNRRRR